VSLSLPVRAAAKAAALAAGGLLVALLALPAVAADEPLADPLPPKQTSPNELQLEATSGLHYLEVITGGGVATDPLPVVVAIHGLGDRPSSFRLLLDDLPAKARVIVPRGPMPHGPDGFSWFNFRADDGDGDGARQLADGIREAAERLAVMMVALTKKHGGPARSVVCGFSQGGMLSFALAAGHPELLAAAVPVAGYLPATLWPAERPKVKPLPKVLALHGEKDHLISLESARWTVEALRANGYDTELRSWPGVGHALPPPVRALLAASVVRAVEELSAPGTVLEGPPSPVRAAPSVDESAPQVVEPTPLVVE